MSITYADGVLEELITLSTFIADGDEAAADRFLAAIDQSFGLLASQPSLGIKKHFSDPRLQDLRMWRVQGFSAYLIFFEPTKSGIHIYHVINAAQDYGRVFESE